MCITPIIMDDFPLIFSTIPLLDKSLQVDVYKSYNLSALLLALGVKFSYTAEGYYLAVSKHGLYVLFPTEHDIHSCMATQIYLCMMNQVLYPMGCLNGVFMLFSSLTGNGSINSA